MSTLNLPELPPAPPLGSHTAYLRWMVTLDIDGDIRVMLASVGSTGTDTVAIAFATARTPQDAEETALKIWTNYQAVHGS
jgi:hypothetical protein